MVENFFGNGVLCAEEVDRLELFEFDLGLLETVELESVVREHVVDLHAHVSLRVGLEVKNDHDFLNVHAFDVDVLGVDNLAHPLVQFFSQRPESLDVELLRARQFLL